MFSQSTGLIMAARRCRFVTIHYPNRPRVRCLACLRRRRHPWRWPRVRLRHAHAHFITARQRRDPRGLPAGVRPILPHRRGVGTDRHRAVTAADSGHQARVVAVQASFVGCAASTPSSRADAIRHCWPDAHCRLEVRMNSGGFVTNLSRLGPPSVRGCAGSLNPTGSPVRPLRPAVPVYGLGLGAAFELWGGRGQFSLCPELVNDRGCGDGAQDAQAQVAERVDVGEAAL